ncbi:renal dipeptidase family [Amylostereum chailletii]|nr:renal dipeptidase family [Amylostereum chailletii]
MLFFYEGVQHRGERGGHGGHWWTDRLPKDPKLAAELLLERSPVIDGHIDLPWAMRMLSANNVSAIDLESPTAGHVDIPRLRKGKVGGFFWSVYVPCSKDIGQDEGEDHLQSTWRVRDTLEQIDVTHLLVNKFKDTFTLARTAADVRQAIAEGKIASIIGLEGGHHLGNSLSSLRQYYALGARYMTLTHTCNNAFAGSSGMVPGHLVGSSDIELGTGLSSLGRTLIREMNRLGMLIDLSHVSDATALDALTLTRAPVIWSHSSARALRNIPRNVPDFVLQKVGEGKGKVDGVVMVNFYPLFVSDDEDAADVKAVADHVDHIAGVIGKKHVGIGSDYDGITSTPHGLEDVSTYPALFAELLSRGWSARDLSGLAGANVLRVMEGAESVAAQMAREGVEPAYEVYKKRLDLPTKNEL